jgi:hypothetical protein
MWTAGKNRRRRNPTFESPSQLPAANSVGQQFLFIEPGPKPALLECGIKPLNHPKIFLDVSDKDTRFLLGNELEGLAAAATESTQPVDLYRCAALQSLPHNLDDSASQNVPPFFHLHAFFASSVRSGPVTSN